MPTPLDDLAVQFELADERGVSQDGLPERYLYSRDMIYRYAFARWWGEQDLATTDVWVLLNPATGDTEKRKRPTLDRCIARSRGAGRTGLVIVNLFAFRHTDPKQLALADDPVGPANDRVLEVLTANAPRTIVAWGGGGSLNGRSHEVAPALTAPMCLGMTASGDPRHPLYVPNSVELQPWSPSRSPQGR